MALNLQMMLRFMEYTKKTMDEMVKFQIAFDIERKTNFLIEATEFHPNSQYDYLDTKVKTLPIDKKLYFVAKYLTTISGDFIKDLSLEDAMDMGTANLEVFSMFAKQYGCDAENSQAIMTRAAADVATQLERRNRDIQDATKKLMDEAQMMLRFHRDNSRSS